MRTSSTAPLAEKRAAAATDSTGKSNEPRRRNFQYVLFQPCRESSSTSARISLGLRRMYSRPSLLYSSASGTSRSSERETNRTRAPSAISAGAVSVEEMAKHFGLPGATQQVVPSFFKQKSMDFRHS